MQDNIVFLGFADNKMPEFKEVKSKDWILNGEDNKFPQHLQMEFGVVQKVHPEIVFHACGYSQ